MTTLIYCSITVFLDNRAVYGIMWKIFYSRTGRRWQ